MFPAPRPILTPHSLERGTRGANILKGIIFLFAIAFLGVLYVANSLELDQIKVMLMWALGLVPIALIIIFQLEIRRGLSRLAQSPLISPLIRIQSRKVVDELVQAAGRLSKNRIGALVVVERDVRLGDDVDAGAPVEAIMTSELLETIFYPGTPLHDGGVIIQGDRIAAAGCFFQLTDDHSVSSTMGTRHRAAIGVTEESDAVAIVVSEETGRISVVVHGKLTPDLSRDSLERLLYELLSERSKENVTAIRRRQPGAGAIPPISSTPPPPSPPATPTPPINPAPEGNVGPSNGDSNPPDTRGRVKRRRKEDSSK